MFSFFVLSRVLVISKNKTGNIQKKTKTKTERGSGGGVASCRPDSSPCHVRTRLLGPSLVGLRSFILFRVSSFSRDGLAEEDSEQGEQVIGGRRPAFCHLN